MEVENVVARESRAAMMHAKRRRCIKINVGDGSRWTSSTWIIAASTRGDWKTGGSASQESMSPMPITWHVIGAWSRDGECPSLQANTGCNHRTHGYLGLNGNHG